MVARRSKKQIEQLKKARSKRAGAVKAGSQGSPPGARWTKKVAATGRIVGGYKRAGSSRVRSPQARPQPRPKLPLLSGGKDPTLAERFEEELYRS